LRELVNRKRQAPSQEIRQADRRHTEVLQRLSIQTVECGQFIAKYAKDRNLFIRAGKQIFGDPKTIIDRFVETFEKLLRALEQQAAVSTEIMVVRVLQTVQKIEMTTDLTGNPDIENGNVRHESIHARLAVDGVLPTKLIVPFLFRCYVGFYCYRMSVVDNAGALIKRLLIRMK